MEFKKSLFLIVFLPIIGIFSSCVGEDNKNLVVDSGGRDPRVDNFFNAVGMPLKNVNGNNFEELSEELSRVSPLFINALPPKVAGNAETAPFFTLAKNVGTYFTSHIWKTQITSPNEVRFFDLNQDTNDVSSGIHYKATDFNLPFVFLNAYGDKTDPKNYLGSVVKGIYGKLNFQTNAFSPISHMYIMEYTLRDENGSRTGTNVRTYYALVSVPVNSTKQYRLTMYAHGGDFGTSSSELITVFNEKLKDFVVVAPLFPGEPLCTQINAQNKGCLRFDEKNSLIPDNIGKYQNPDIAIPFNSIVPIAYKRSPLLEDINAFLGAHNAVARTMNLSLNGTNPFYNADLPHQSVLIAMEHPETLLNFFQYPNNPVAMIPTGIAPQTLGVGSSRGGSVLLSAIGRIGFLINGVSLNTPFPHTVQDAEGTFEFQYPLFNSAALFFSPTSSLTGKLRLFTIMLMQNQIESIASLPMAGDLARNDFFTNYRNDENYLSEIQMPLKVNNVFSLPAQDSLSQLITFVASNDITFLAPFISTGLQNWNSYYFKEHTRAPSSLILLHGSQDAVVPMTESTIASQAMDAVWAGLYHTPIDPYGNYLSTPQYNAMHPALAGSFSPGVGVAQYTFQPTNHFFNIPCDKKMLASIQQPDVIYNTDVGRCFGGGYSPQADGTNTTGSFYGHMDASFFTGNLLNTISNANLPMAVLSSNMTTNDSTDHYTLGYDSAQHSKYGKIKFDTDADECTKDTDNCFSYQVFRNSPTFMRYMSAEGMLSGDIFSAKKQIFEGEFKSKNTSNLKPHDVFFTWLDSVACDNCTVETQNDLNHFGVFHDFSKF